MNDIIDELSTEELERLSEEARRRRLRRQQAAAVAPSQGMLWLALVPRWTLRLAKAAEIPLGQGDIEAEFTRLRTAGELSLRGDCYVMNDAFRAAVLDQALADRGGGLAMVRRVLHEVGERLGRLLQAPDENPMLARWAEFASLAEQPQQMVQDFDRRIATALANHNPAEVENWIEAARPMAVWLSRDGDGSMDVAVQRAGLQLELLHRENADRRHLGEFFQRREQIAAVRKLVRGRDDEWALHLIGVGGVGKTMLIRYITSELAKRWELATARIDFDYLNADYPLLAPGHLLWSFGQQLRAYDATLQARSAFDQGDDLLRKLHLELRTVPGAPRRRGTENPLFGQALNFYLEALNLLPQRVLLILDTCEELAKVAPDGTVPDNVVETFRILRALHDGSQVLGIPSLPRPPGLGNKLRVIFSGRRPLSQQGAGWRSKAQHLEQRPYLQLHEIRGFSYAEAQRYLRDKAKVDRAYIETIIEKSAPEVGRVAGLSFDNAANKPELPRCNPFELKLYADWSKETPAPTPEELREAKNSYYVEHRILRRLGFEAWRPMLRAMALLGHFDADTLRAITGAEQFDAALAKLQQQEWIFQRDVANEDGRIQVVLGVEPGVRRRLLDYFRGRLELGEVSRRAAQYMEELTLGGDLAKLNWSHFDAALRVLENDPRPERAAEWWLKVDDRLRRQRDPAWALDVLGFIQGPDGAAAQGEDEAAPGARQESTMRPAVLASYASALLHVRPSAEIDSVWAEVAAKASRVPLEGLARQLSIRARAGRLAACRFNLRVPQLKELLDLLFTETNSVADRETQAGLLGAVEALVEHAERSPGYLSPQDARTTVSMLAATSIDMHSHASWSHALAGRMLALTGQDEARHHFLEALKSAAPTGQSGEPWYSLVLPAKLALRIGLEFARCMCPALMSADDILGAMPEQRGYSATDDIDVDRFKAVLMSLRLAQAPLDVDELSAIEAGLTERLPMLDPPRCNAHEQVPPLAVVLAEALCNHGRLAGLAVLRRLARVRDGQQARRALARVARRFRLPAESIALRDSPLVADRALLWAIEALAWVREPALAQPPNDTPDPADWVHAIWQTSTATQADEARALLARFADSRQDERLMLDHLEADRMAEADPVADRGTSPDLPASLVNAPESKLQYQLRQDALSVSEASLTVLVNRLGVRRAAEIALLEAELLSLRLPRPALLIVSRAATWFESCEDHFGHLGARLVEAVLHARLRNPSQCSASLKQMTSSYNAIRRQHPDLPEFDDVEAFVRDEQRLPEPVQDWLYLLARLAFCQLVQRQAKQPYKALDATVLHRRMDHLMGRTIGESRLLPIEFDGAFVDTRASTGARTISLSLVQKKPRWRSGLEFGAAIALGLGSLGVLLGLGAAILSGLAWVLGNVVPALMRGVPDNRDGAFIITGVIIALLLGGGGFLSWIVWNTSSFLRLRITAVAGLPSDPFEPIPLTLVQAIVSPRFEAQLIFRRLTVGGSTATVSGDSQLAPAPYGDVDPLIPDALREQYLEFEGRLRFGKPELVIQPADGLHGAPWEAIVVRAQAKGAKVPAISPFRFRREAGEQRARKAIAAHTVNVGTLRTGEIESGIYARAWQAEVQDIVASEADNLQGKSAVPASHILHLFGTAEDAGVGVSFRVGDAADASRWAPSVEAAKMTETALSASDLARVCRTMRVCVLQGLVDRNTVGVRDSDRRRASLARSFAAELFAQGVPVVIVVPQLDARGAELVAKEIATALKARPVSGCAALESAVERARFLVASAEGGNEPANWERAYDICLYAEAGWDGSWRD